MFLVHLAIRKTNFRDNYPRCSVKKGVLKNVAIFAGISFRPATLLKKTPKQVFSCEYCEFVKSIYLFI